MMIKIYIYRRIQIFTISNYPPREDTRNDFYFNFMRLCILSFIDQKQHTYSFFLLILFFSLADLVVLRDEKCRDEKANSKRRWMCI